MSFSTGDRLLPREGEPHTQEIIVVVKIKCRWNDISAGLPDVTVTGVSYYE